MAFHQYNTDEYNTAQYNADARFWTKAFSDSIASSDVDVMSMAQALAETLTLSVVDTMSMTRLFVESLVLIDSLAKSIPNKVFTEQIRLQDWLSIKKSPAQNIWGD